MMKCLTLTQPFGTLVASGAKTIETRDWSTSYRGELLITGSKKFPAECRELCPQEPFNNALGVETLHTGKALCVVELIECFQFDATTIDKIRARSAKGLLPPFEADFGDYGEGRYGLVFRNRRRLAEPIPCKGALGLWRAPVELEEEVRRQLAIATDTPPAAPTLADSAPVVKKQLVQALDGNFTKEWPTNEKFSLRAPSMQTGAPNVWHICCRGPSYNNLYEVLEFNPAAEKWLTDNDRTEKSPA